MKNQKNTLTGKEVLQAAREKISTPDRWAQGHFSRGKSGRPVILGSKAACSWCALGAVLTTDSPQSSKQEAEFAMTKACVRLHSCSVPTFNDGVCTLHEDVLALFDEAIKECDLPAPCASPEPS